MIFYILLFGIVPGILVGCKKETYEKLSFLILWGVYAFREALSGDDLNYIYAFKRINLNEEFDIEWTYKILTKLGGTLDLNYKFIFIVYSVLTMFFLYKAVCLIFEKYDKAVYMVCYMGMIFVTSIVVMRQFLAASICFYAYALMGKGEKIVRPIILCCIASCFHYVAIITIPILMIFSPKIKISYMMKLTIVGGCALAGYFNIATVLLELGMLYLPKSYQLYSNRISGTYSSAGGTVSLVLLAMYVVQCIISAKMISVGSKEWKEECIEKGQLVYLSLLFFFVHAGIASRLAFTFIPFIATLPISFAKRITNKKVHIAYKIALTIAMFSLMVMTIKNISELQSGMFIPYKGSLKFWN